MKKSVTKIYEEVLMETVRTESRVYTERKKIGLISEWLKIEHANADIIDRLSKMAEELEKIHKNLATIVLEMNDCGVEHFGIED